ncbi:hypothetical protein HanXRQr2_Chr06g0250661 [Helianthus annuus]|uniref:Uncharacterized protein n=1 Tax=Helianthus annuus TaxID=4232 RepID=A0A9K3IS08_HELAN|nr:hypothetical protein HanXRQr2_Chr06g0250661 [Helianthus annuus]
MICWWQCEYMLLDWTKKTRRRNHEDSIQVFSTRISNQCRSSADSPKPQRC